MKQHTEHRRRRLLGLASLGLALSVGVGVTSLAAWQQHQVLQGTNDQGNQFTSTFLALQLSLDGGQTWNDLAVSGTGSTSVSFGTGAAALTPGDTVYASVLLRAKPGSRGADLALTGGSVGSNLLLGALTYAARFGVASADCTPVSFSSVGTALVNAGSALTTPATRGFRVPAAPVGGGAGTEVGVCLAVALPNGVLPNVGNTSAQPTWQFDATSY